MKKGPVAYMLRMHGRVQGVYYRNWMVDVAKELGLDGWVRNRMDGTVEALIVGPTSAVDAMIQLCREGPPAAIVDRVEIDDALGITAKGFMQKPTV